MPIEFYMPWASDNLVFTFAWVGLVVGAALVVAMVVCTAQALVRAIARHNARHTAPTWTPYPGGDFVN